MLLVVPEASFFGTFRISHQEQMTNLLAGSNADTSSTDAKYWDLHVNKVFSGHFFFGESRHIYTNGKQLPIAVNVNVSLTRMPFIDLESSTQYNAFVPCFPMEDLVVRTNFG